MLSGVDPGFADLHGQGGPLGPGVSHDDSPPGVLGWSVLVEVVVESAAGVGDALPGAGEGCGGGVDVGAGGFDVGA